MTLGGWSIVAEANLGGPGEGPGKEKNQKSFPSGPQKASEDSALITDPEGGQMPPKGVLIADWKERGSVDEK